MASVYVQLPVLSSTPTGTVNIVDKAYVNLAGMTTAGYTTVINSTAAAAKKITYFESTGQATVLKIDGVDKLNIPPGGFNGEIEIDIPAGVKLEVKGLSGNGTANTYCVINLLG